MLTRAMLLKQITQPSPHQVKMAGLQAIFGLLWLIEAEQAPPIIAACSRIHYTGIFTRAWKGIISCPWQLERGIT